MILSKHKNKAGVSVNKYASFIQIALQLA